MGFSDELRIPVSDTQAYRQFGNAVCLPVTRAVTAALLPHLSTVIQDSDGFHPLYPLSFTGLAA